MILKKLVFTGGGTAGHVTPNLALMDAVRERGWEVCYLGSTTGIEREMVVKAGVPFHPVASAIFLGEILLTPFISSLVFSKRIFCLDDCAQTSFFLKVGLSRCLLSYLRGCGKSR